jgi:hypothetical protein
MANLMCVFSLSKASLSRALVLMPIILATEEAEIRRTAVQSKPRRTVCKTLSGKTLPRRGLVGGPR